MVGGARRAVSLTSVDHQLPAPGPTFAGRDVFAPAAAHLCNGVDLAELGEVVDPVTLLPGVLPLARHEDGVLHAEVLWVDRYGNAQLNVGPEDLAAFGERITIRWSADEVRTGTRCATYGLLKAGQVGLIVDSYGLVSIALDRQSAAAQLRIRPGDAVQLAEPT